MINTFRQKLPNAEFPSSLKLRILEMAQLSCFISINHFCGGRSQVHGIFTEPAPFIEASEETAVTEPLHVL
jgi:hypothetical protein